VTSTPLWFGPDDRRLFGWLHVPEAAAARAGVVLCPPLAQEYLDTHATFRQLAFGLQARGMVALRLDYAGTGDSFGDEDDPGGVEAMTASIGHALGLLRRAGCRRTALVGMRMGAALAANAAELDGRVDALALWDPCASGRSFLREVRSLRMTRTGAADPLYEARTMDDLEKVTIVGTTGPLASRCLVLTRPDHPVDHRMAERLSMPHTEWATAHGQREVLDVGSLDSQVPEATANRIVSWLDAVIDTDASTVSVPSIAKTAIGRNMSGREVVERPWNGTPTGLFGVTSEAEGASGPTFVFLNTAKEHHVGSSRLWVQLSRRLAGHGFRTLRVDLSGLGDSPARSGLSRNLAYVPEAADDVIDVARALSPQDPGDVVLVGHCSGAHAAIHAGIRLSPRGVCVINAPLSFKPAEVDSVGIDPRVRAAAQTPSWLLHAGRSTPASALLRRIPPGARTFLDRRQERAPARLLQDLVRTNADVLLVAGDEDARPLRQRAPRELAQLAQSGRFRFEIVHGLDHRLLLRTRRDALADVVVRHLATRFGPVPAVAEHPDLVSRRWVS